MPELVNLGELDKLMDEAHEAERKLNELIKEKGQALLTGLFKWVFDNSDVICVHWEQYTPYFNDGEECTFSIRDPFFVPRQKGMPANNSEWYECEADNWNPHGFYYTQSQYRPNPTPAPEWATEKNWSVISEFSKKFWELGDVLERIFGDHVSVTVSLKDDGSIEFASEHVEHE